ncbi:MAG: PD40 domain-containing protein, partial [Bdellovibrio sp.]|nr:PD40 domain-containing protein [Bdellovibrio sp.]
MCSTSLAKQQNSLELLGDMFSLSPFWSWKTIETTHFRITFPKELSSQAQKSAQYFEEAHSILSPILKWEPRNKTQILIIDNSDMANGVTSPALRLGIVLYMVPPDNWESIFYEDNWLRLLVFHEYTHFLNMDPTHGVWTGLRYIFGDILLPNAFWPAWMLEGLAVYIETHFTKVGRGRSPFYEGLLRSAVEQNVFNSSKFITIDKIFGENPYFPGGETPYLFGYQLMNWIAKESPRNINVLGELSEYSSYCFPWLLDYYLNKTASTNWKKTWTDWVDFTQDRLKKEIEQIKAQPLTPIKKITEKGFSVLGSCASPDGNWLAYTQNSLDRRWSLYLRNLNTKETTRLDEKFFGAHLDFSPDSRFLVYSALHRMSQYYYFSDLAVYDLNEKRSYWLTNSLRAKDPSYSKDGKWIVFTLTENSRVGIAIASVMYEKNRLKLGEVQKLFMSEMFDRSASPIFSPDGKKVIFSLHKTNHTSEEIVELDIDLKSNENKIPNILIENKSYNRHPAFDATGNLYFVSDFTGVDNVFKLKQNTAKITQVTNVIAGVWFPTFGPKGIYASIFSVDGFDLAQIELLEKPISESQPIKKTTDWAPPVYKGNDDHHVLESKTYTEQNYSVFPSILPRLWYPIISFNSSLEGYVGGQVAGFDATDRHQYVLGTGYAFKQKKVDGFVQYTTRLLGPNLSYAWSYVTSATENNGDIFYRKLTHSASLTYPWRFTSSTLTPSISLFLEREYK